VAPVDGQRPGARRGARHENDVQSGFSFVYAAGAIDRIRQPPTPHPHMARSPQSLRQILAADPALAAWDARRRREAALTTIVRRHLPRPLAERLRVAEERGTELNLVADAGAIAAVARQRAPDLLAELQREGCEFTSIRVRVQVGTARNVVEKPVPKQIDRTALRPLQALVQELPAGPLKSALARFLRHAA
jgi:hypothetical protein